VTRAAPVCEVLKASATASESGKTVEEPSIWIDSDEEPPAGAWFSPLPHAASATAATASAARLKTFVFMFVTFCLRFGALDRPSGPLETGERDSAAWRSARFWLGFVTGLLH
jgi:hypothetical protein